MKILLYCLILFCLGVRAEDSKELKSQLAGSWYPANPALLRKQIAGYVGDPEKKKLHNVIGLILPHAGYRFSGSVAGYGIREITGGKYSRVIIIGPSHYHFFNNRINVPDITACRTPLGTIQLDSEFIRKLKKLPFVTSKAEYHAKEHCIQIQMPFLQFALPGVKVVPILIGQLDLATIRKVSRALLKMLDKKTLVIASTDFTHYGRRFGYMPFGNNFMVAKKIELLDMKAFSYIQKKNLTGFMKFVKQYRVTICGRNAVDVLIAMLPENSRVHLLKYATSAKITGPSGESVSYLAAAITGEWTRTAQGQWKKPAERKVISLKLLTPEARKNLLQMARKTIEFYLKRHRLPTATELGVAITPVMCKPFGAFVTLRENGALRGCIGSYPRAGVPLYKVVIGMARAAAFDDPRFRALGKEEMKDIDIEISVLTPPEPVKSWKDIVLDRDGIILRKNRRSAVFLPQVAAEQDWSLEDTLDHLSRKAGLPEKSWRQGAEFKVFQAEIFGEKAKK